MAINGLKGVTSLPLVAWRDSLLESELWERKPLLGMGYHSTNWRKRREL